jgi:hypothetical protein
MPLVRACPASSGIRPFCTAIHYKQCHLAILNTTMVPFSPQALKPLSHRLPASDPHAQRPTPCGRFRSSSGRAARLRRATSRRPCRPALLFRGPGLRRVQNRIGVAKCADRYSVQNCWLLFLRRHFLLLYPFIPAARGGGSFLDVPTAIVNVKLSSTKSADLGDLFDTGQTEDQPEFPAGVTVHARTGSVALIEVTSDSLFISRVDDNGGPPCWAEGHLPRVFELPRNTVESVEYEMPASSKLQSGPPASVGLVRRIWRTIFGAPHPFKYVCSLDAMAGVADRLPANLPKVLIGPQPLPSHPAK